MQAVNKWREEQMKEWAVSQGRREEKYMSGLRALQDYSINYKPDGNKLRRSDDWILEIDCEIWQIKGPRGQKYDQIT